MPKQTLEQALERYISPDGAQSASFLLERNGQAAGIGSVREMELGAIRLMNGTTVLDKAADTAALMEYAAKVKEDKTLSQHLINYTITTEVLDRSNDIIKADGVMLDQYKRNNVLFWNHWSWGMPVGNGYNPKLENKSINMDFQFHGMNDSETWSETVGLLCLAKVIKACSVGIIPLSWDDLDIDDNTRKLYPTIYPSWSNKIRIYKKSEMYECSPCSVPMNPEAVQASFGSAEFEEEVKAMVSKGVLSSENPFLTFIARAISRTPNIFSGNQEKAGRKISAENLSKLQQASDLLGEVIASAASEEGEEENKSQSGSQGGKTNDSGISRKQYDRDMNGITASLAEITTTLKHLTSDVEALRKGTSADPEPPKPNPAPTLTEAKMQELLEKINKQ
jgi:hypothetical protein